MTQNENRVVQIGTEWSKIGTKWSKMVSNCSINVPTVVLQVDGVDRGRKIGFNAKDSYISLYNQG